MRALGVLVRVSTARVCVLYPNSEEDKGAQKAADTIVEKVCNENPNVGETVQAIENLANELPKEAAKRAKTTTPEPEPSQVAVTPEPEQEEEHKEENGDLCVQFLSEIWEGIKWLGRKIMAIFEDPRVLHVFISKSQ